MVFIANDNLQFCANFVSVWSDELHEWSPFQMPFILRSSLVRFYFLFVLVSLKMSREWRHAFCKFMSLIFPNINNKHLAHECQLKRRPFTTNTQWFLEGATPRQMSHDLTWRHTTSMRLAGITWSQEAPTSLDVMTSSNLHFLRTCHRNFSFALAFSSFRQVIDKWFIGNIYLGAFNFTIKLNRLICPRKWEIFKFF